MPRSKPGKSLEALISSLERVLARNNNVTVESPKFFPDRITGESREHDVVITLTGSHHKSTIAIECRDRSRKVTVNEIESFWSKCQDTGIDQGIIVSSKGFTKTALTKSLHRGIRCFRLSEASSFNWLLTTGIRIRHRRVVHTNGPSIQRKILFRSQPYSPFSPKTASTSRLKIWPQLFTRSSKSLRMQSLRWGVEQRRSCSCRLAYCSETTQLVIHMR